MTFTSMSNPEAATGYNLMLSRINGIFNLQQVFAYHTVLQIRSKMYGSRYRSIYTLLYHTQTSNCTLKDVFSSKNHNRHDIQCLI